MPSYSENTSRLIRLLGTAGEERNGIWSDGGYWGETQTKHNGASQGEEQGNLKMVFCKSGSKRDVIALFVVEAT